MRVNWRRLTAVTAAVVVLLLAIFHRPLLLGIGRKVAISQAAKQNLKVDLRLEGDVFTNIQVRNLHVTPTGPSPIESLDIDLARVDYSVLGLIRHGFAGVRAVNLQSARVVI